MLRLSLASVSLLASSLSFAAPAIEVAPLGRSPLQLSLPFMVASPIQTLAATPLNFSAAPILTPVAVLARAAVLPAPSAAVRLAAPVPMAAPTARTAAWGSMPSTVAQAFRSGDAREFWAACQRAGFAPPASDDAQQSLLQEGALLAEADRRVAASRTVPAPVVERAPARSTKIDYEIFGEGLAGRTFSENIFDQTSAKRAILKRAGYTHLYGRGGVRVAIDDAADARIGLAFTQTLRAYRRRQAR